MNISSPNTAEITAVQDALESLIDVEPESTKATAQDASHVIHCPGGGGVTNADSASPGAAPVAAPVA
eukprot:1684591-Prorocentrum_lima.AAC.1